MAVQSHRREHNAGAADRRVCWKQAGASATVPNAVYMPLHGFFLGGIGHLIGHERWGGEDELEGFDRLQLTLQVQRRKWKNMRRQF